SEIARCAAPARRDDGESGLDRSGFTSWGLKESRRSRRWRDIWTDPFPKVVEVVGGGLEMPFCVTDEPHWRSARRARRRISARRKPFRSSFFDFLEMECRWR
ncbi:MAG: hypothetical protein M3478_06710, partial [Planctomycetota bacterium]|nr:hypothetical protein [Planctomycetota bacterium]